VGQVHLRHAPTAKETLDNVTAIDECPLHNKAYVTRSRYYKAHHQTIDRYP
jgi:hypothetical protein